MLRFKNLRLILLFLALSMGILCVSPSLYAVEKLVYRPTNSSTDAMVVDLLRLILSKSGVDFTLTPTPDGYTDDRAVAELETDGISIYWTMTSNQNEERMLPIRYPVDKGLLGYRVFIIRKGDQHRFDSINSIADLREFSAGQGRTWPDTEILKSAGLPVVTTVKYINLFPMLDGERFDYFPRGIHEPWAELITWSKYPLTVESNIVLKYPAALYFFVRKDNAKLAEILSTGFENAIQDGSYDRAFYTANPIRELVKNSNLTKRLIINIDNPLLPSRTPLERKELWFDSHSPLLTD